jgi:predicted Zn-dependent protease
MDGSRIITINANCNWAEFSLTVTILHEYGHILLGTPEHSSDPRSVMYSVVLPNQTVTAADREKLQAKR